jgi:ABC-type phosphate/phosphonate transport system substrate-binding protein
MSYSRRLVVATVALLTTLSIGALAKSPQAKEASAAEQAVLKADNERFTAMLKADTAALEKLLADELSYTHSNAQVQDKAAFISDIKTGKIKYLTIEATDQKARVFGTTAIVTGGASVHVVQNGNDLTFKIRYTNTHLNRGGAWQMVAWQSTRLPA